MRRPTLSPVVDASKNLGLIYDSSLKYKNHDLSSKLQNKCNSFTHRIKIKPLVEERYVRFATCP